MKQTIPDQIRAAIREFGRATEDEIAAALPDIPRERVIDALRHMPDAYYDNPRMWRLKE